MTLYICLEWADCTLHMAESLKRVAPKIGGHQMRVSLKRSGFFCGSSPTAATTCIKSHNLRIEAI
jgi:hypothetical protein